MKALPILLAASSLLLALPALRAQDAGTADPAPATPATAPSAPPSPASPALDLMPAQPEPILPPSATELIPERPTTTEKPRGTALPETKEKKEKQNTTEAAENALQERIRYRHAKTRAMRDPAVRAEWDRSEAAHTDFEKREALKRYYKLLYARMAKIDGSLKKEIALREQASLRRLDQTRIDPTTGRLNLGDERITRLDQE